MTRLFYLLIFSFSIVSCENLPEFSDSISIASNGWDIQDTHDFSWEVTEASVKYEAYVDVRHTGDYPFSNLYLFVDLIYPNGKSRLDTIECVLADRRGKWHGTGLGDVLDNRVVYKSGFQFPSEGEYTLSITHGMRVNPLLGVMEVGFCLEKTEK